MIVGVIGAGTMGAGIAQVALQAGHEVLLNDIDEAAISRGRDRIADGLRRLVAKERITPADAILLLGRLRDAHGLDAVALEADLVIEAALEDIELKRVIFGALDSAARPDAILATNTSALSVESIADATSRPDRVVGLHFFNPAPVMALVEVVAAPRTSSATVEAAVAFCTDAGKTTVVCADSPGFIVNRVNRPFTLEALRLVHAGKASIGEVDAVIEAAGYPMGPFRLMDLVGIDVNLAVARALFEAFHEEPRFRPSPLQESMVASNTLGRKTGRGFYDYGDDAPTPGEAV
ncbi:MAG: 3-hydroxyacyl-CoA dehydrogenase NAD-binding domain-containing protein, partial [Candidatus Limnocylindrales bacterium]